MDFQHCVVITGLSSVSLSDLGKFFSRFGVVVRVDQIDPSSVLVEFADKDGARSALSYHGGSYRDDTITMFVPSADFLKQRGFPITTIPTSSVTDLLRQNLKQLVSLTPASEAVSVLESVTSEIQKSLWDPISVVDSSVVNHHPDLTAYTLPDFSTPVVSSPVPTVATLMSSVPTPVVTRPVSTERPGSTSEVSLLDLPNEFIPVSTVVPGTKVTFATSSSTPVISSEVRPPPGFAPRPGHTPLIPEPSPMSYSYVGKNFVPVPSFQFPKIVFFSGDEGKDASYQQWSNEVRSLVKEGHPTSNILQGIRRSLKGTAASVLLNLGDDISPESIIRKFDVVFGVASSYETLLEEFYTSRQKTEESIVAWGCRLESMLYNLDKKFGNLTENSKDMLRTRFWSGLRDDRIKSALRHKFDAGLDFEALLTAARTVVLEYSPAPTLSPSAKVFQPKVQVQQTSTLESRLDSLSREMSDLKRLVQQPPRVAQTNPSSHPRCSDPDVRRNLVASGSCFYCRQAGHFLADCPTLKNKSAPMTPKDSGNELRPAS